MSQHPLASHGRTSKFVHKSLLSNTVFTTFVVSNIYHRFLSLSGFGDLVNLFRWPPSTFFFILKNRLTPLDQASFLLSHLEYLSFLTCFSACSFTCELGPTAIQFFIFFNRLLHPLLWLGREAFDNRPDIMDVAGVLRGGKCIVEAVAGVDVRDVDSELCDHVADHLTVSGVVQLGRHMSCPVSYG